MITPREQLIADWRERLAAASDVEEESPSRAAWLARLRIRLYRFLLSLYGSGEWNAPPTEPTTADDAAKSVVFDNPSVLPFAGKAAKSDGKIREVLKAVANCQEHRPEAGTLTADDVASGWFVVAAQSSNLNVWHFESALRRRGIECRLLARGDDTMVEVPGWLRKEAMDLLDEHRSELRQTRPTGQRPIGQRRPRPIATLVEVIVFVTSVASVVQVLIFTSVAFQLPPYSATLVPQAVALAGTVCITLASFVWAFFHHRKRRRSMQSR